jgi:hypothetical protein
MGAPEVTQLERLESKLKDWAHWMEGYRPNLGSHSSTFQSTGGHDFESLFSGVEKQVMKSIETAIDDLTPTQSAAIQSRYLHVTWRFPRENYMEMLEKAHETLLVSLPRRNVIL